jgi:hypothetical protein
VSDHQQGPGWWLASDGKWYPPEGAPPLPPPQTWAPGPPPGPPPKQGMSAGAIVALVLGCVVGVLVLAGVAVAVLGTESESKLAEVEDSIGDSDGDGGEPGATLPAADVPEGFELADGDGVVMATPAGWELIDAADVAMGSDELAQAFPDAPQEMVEQGMNVFEQGAVLVAFDFSGGDFASNVNVIEIPGEVPLTAIEGQAVQQLGTLGGEVVESGIVDVAAGEALRIVYTLAVAAPDGSSVPARGVQFYVPVDGSTYIITVSTGADGAGLADQMIETFRVG